MRSATTGGSGCDYRTGGRTNTDLDPRLAKTSDIETVTYIIAMDRTKVNVFLPGTDGYFDRLQGGHILRCCKQ